jgi:hypothetical protein
MLLFVFLDMLVYQLFKNKYKYIQYKVSLSKAADLQNKTRFINKACLTLVLIILFFIFSINKL